jgi:hypothetical protein
VKTTFEMREYAFVVESLMSSLERNEPEIAPSTQYAIACVLEGVPFINGSPQNTFVPGLVDLAVQHKSLIAGDDFKSGQTKMKSVIVDFLIGAGIKPTSIVSYNHLGNNDGYNLSAPQTFRSKEISKSSVVDDMVASNTLLYPEGEHPDHVVVIKYAPVSLPVLHFLSCFLFRDLNCYVLGNRVRMIKGYVSSCVLGEELLNPDRRIKPNISTQQPPIQTALCVSGKFVPCKACMHASLLASLHSNGCAVYPGIFPLCSPNFPGHRWQTYGHNCM